MTPPPHSPSSPALFVCAMADEARQFSVAIEKIGKRSNPISQPSFKVVKTGLGADQIHRKLKEVCTETPKVIMVAGTAGSLNSDYKAGDLVVFSSAVDDSGRTLPLSSDWIEILQSALASLHPKLGIGFTSTDAVTSALAKSALHQEHSADCVDMETTTVIRFANEKNIPVAAFRIIVDPFEQSIPPVALAGLKADGTTDAMATIFALLKQPHHLPQNLKELISLGRQYRQSMKTLSDAAKLVTHFISNSPATKT